MDEQDAHRHFAPSCFNKSWELLEELGDEPEEEEADELVLTAAASLWHWTRRDDVTAKNRSVGAWLLARTLAVVNRPAEAIHWAERSLRLAEEAGGEPFYVGYAYEALARARWESDPDQARRDLARAREIAANVADDEMRELLEDDLQEFE